MEHPEQLIRSQARHWLWGGEGVNCEVSSRGRAW